MRVGVLDIGSNSVLLLVGERAGAGWRILTDQTRITRLGEGFGEARQLQPEAIARTLQAVDEYLAHCRALQVERVVAAATAVVREASNPDAMVQPLRARLPDYAVLRVLSEADEATKLGWYSPCFGHKVPCTTLVVEAKPLPDAIEGAGVVWSFQA